MSPATSKARRERDPPRISIALNAFGGASVLFAVLFLGGSFYMGDDLARAFCLGAFFSGLLGAILLFGFAKVIDLLDAIRAQTVAHEAELPFEAEPERAAGADATPGRSE